MVEIGYDSHNTGCSEIEQCRVCRDCTNICDSKNCHDCHFSNNLQNCECCKNCSHLQNCDNCINVHYSTHCDNAINALFCVNLQIDCETFDAIIEGDIERFYILNEECTKKEFDESADMFYILQNVKYVCRFGVEFVRQKDRRA